MFMRDIISTDNTKIVTEFLKGSSRNLEFQVISTLMDLLSFFPPVAS